MTRFIDLHIHTDRSDGVCSPEEILENVRNKKLSAFSITDHDTLEGYFAIKKLLRDNDPELVTGVELSATFQDKDLHILGYMIDPTNSILGTALDKMQRQRNIRGQEMVQKLNRMGVDISLDDIRKLANDAAIGRPHVAEAIFKAGITTRYEEAFEKYIGNGKPAYVPRANFSPKEALSLIHQAGGVAVLAHPAINETYQQLEMLSGKGLDGIEVYHPAHKQWQIDRFKNMADQYNLIITGGSDFHGREGRYGNIGSQHVPEKYLATLRQKAQYRKEHA